MTDGMSGSRLAACALGVLVLAGGFADSYLNGLARDNLSSAGFNRTHERVPTDVGIAYNNVTIPSGTLDLAGWWMPSDGGPNATTTVILVHGVSATMGFVVRHWAANLHAAGYSLLAFDLRNHGASPDGRDGFVTYGVDEADDVAAAVVFVRGHAQELGVEPGSIVLYGGSMGAATVLNTAARDLPGVVGAIADSAYASFAFQAHLDGAKKGYPRWLVDLVLDRMDELAPSPPSESRPDLAVQAAKVPLLLAQCSDDLRVTEANYDLLATLAPQGTASWIEPCPTGLSKDHHVDGFMHASYNQTVLAFLDRL